MQKDAFKTTGTSPPMTPEDRARLLKFRNPPARYFYQNGKEYLQQVGTFASDHQVFEVVTDQVLSTMGHDVGVEEYEKVLGRHGRIG